MSALTVHLDALFKAATSSLLQKTQYLTMQQSNTRIFVILYARNAGKAFSQKIALKSILIIRVRKKDCTYITHLQHNLLRHKKMHENQRKKRAKS